MIEAVTQEVEIRRDAAFVLGALEQVEDVLRCPGEDVKAVGFTACEQEEQRTVEQVVHEPQSRQEAFGVRVVPRERVKQHTAEQGVPQLREETAEAVSSIPCERVQQQAVKGMAGEQSEVTEVTETASQDRNLQRALDQTLLDFVGAVKIVPQMRISERMWEHFCVIEVPKNSRQESVEIVKIIPQERISEQMNRARLSRYPRPQAKTGVCSAQWSVPSGTSEADKSIPQERIFRMDV